MSSLPLPLFVDLRGARVLVLGSTPAAVAVVRRALLHGAKVRCVAPDTSAMKSAGLDGEVELIDGSPAAEHLAGCLLVISASLDPAVDASVLEAAATRGTLAIGVTGGVGSAWLGEIAGEGRVAVAVTSQGSCAAFDARLVKEAARAIKPEHAKLVEILAGVRARLEDRFPDEERRSAIWEQILDSPVVLLIESGSEDEAVEMAERMAWGTG